MTIPTRLPVAISVTQSALEGLRHQFAPGCPTHSINASAVSASQYKSANLCRKEILLAQIVTIPCFQVIFDLSAR